MNKKWFSIAAVVIAVLTMPTRAQAGAPEFAYEAGFEVVSAYLWRGQYDGGLSFQPYFSVGYTTDNTNFAVGVGASLGASDWEFKNDGIAFDDYNPNTFFVPECDLTLSYMFYGVTIEANYYQFASYLPLEKKFDPYYQMEVGIGYSLECLLDIPLYISWHTMVAGDDYNYNTISESEDIETRAYSSYLELGYSHTFKHDITLSGAIGMSPLRSDNTYGNSRFAVTNLDLRLEKNWDFDACSVTLFAEGCINPYGIRYEKVVESELAEEDRTFVLYAKGAGDDKLYRQTLNGCVGVGVWF